MLLTKQRRDRLDTAIMEMAEHSDYTEMVHRLGCLRGLSTLTGFGLAVEIGESHGQKFVSWFVRPVWAICCGMGNEDGDVDANDDGRDETVNERMDRNWNEMLQEMRVTQTGTQILSGFLLTIAFQPKFADLDSFDKGVYLVLVLASVLTTALALAPVHLHRSLFRQHAKPTLVATGHLLLRAALIGLAVVMTGTVMLVFDVATGDRTVAIAVSAAVMLGLIVLACIPAVTRTDWARRKVGESIK